MPAKLKQYLLTSSTACLLHGSWKSVFRVSGLRQTSVLQVARAPSQSWLPVADDLCQQSWWQPAALSPDVHQEGQSAGPHLLADPTRGGNPPTRAGGLASAHGWHHAPAYHSQRAAGQAFPTCVICVSSPGSVQGLISVAPACFHLPMLHFKS